MGVYKELEFKAFVKMIEDGQQAHWYEMAEALGVDQDTITKWKNEPEALAARQKGIEKALAGMERAGGKDWRMWAEKLKMLGVNPQTKVAIQIDDPANALLKKFGLGNDAGQTPEA